MTRFRLPGRRQFGCLGLMALLACAAPLPAAAQAEGGLYVAGAGFSFEQAAADGLSGNSGGQRFFLLVLPPQTEALTSKASRTQAAARKRVVDGNGVLLVCRRDIERGTVDASRLMPGVVPVRGWPQSGSGDLAEGQRYFPGEDRTHLPQSDELLRRLRSTCS